jgi:glucose-6-phosphate isomerase
MPLRDLDIWRRLAAHRDHVRTQPVRDLFRDDPQRFEALSFRLDDLLVDLSKHLATRDTLPLLAELARVRGVEAAPRGAPCCTWRCATGPGSRSSSTAAT